MMTVELPPCFLAKARTGAVKYVDLTPDKVKEIFSKHVIGEQIVTEYALAQGSFFKSA